MVGMIKQKTYDGKNKVFEDGAIEDYETFESLKVNWLCCLY